ncbi:hypothetical protein AAG570_003137 [Ranatra chinensis]|uniref:Beta-mannosidase n=1 Tax=Ranatra chinensis TaxID=642074 RepID=A0ABD0Y6I6_9HEMI
MSTEGVLVASLFFDRQSPAIRARKNVRPILVNNHLEDRIILNVPKEKVELWWPNGYGEQKLYDLTVSFKSGPQASRKLIKIGFREIELVQDPVAADPDKGLSFYFKVNGVPIFAKGSNWIPSHVLPEHSANIERVHNLLSSAKQANFNMLRVWGGGLYESDMFYQLCDELGIMVWQDMMFACNMYPSESGFLNSVSTEIQQQVNRLQHHASIALWAGNNENEAALRENWYGTAHNFSLYKQDYIKLYVDTIKTAVKSADPTRPFLTSSPSNGLETEKEGYVSENPQSSLYGDVHYYNYMANGWSWLIYPKTRFASEYGIQSLPSLATLSQAAVPSDLVIGSKFLNHRQHLAGGYEIMTLLIYKNLPQFNSLETFIYFSQINQAMTVKTETETYRRERSKLYDTGEGLTMGALYWQLNDIWQAPSWSSIDYNGTWKMLHYYAKDFFAPIITSPVVTADSIFAVTIVSDLLINISSAQLVIKLYKYNSTDFAPVSDQQFNVTVSKSTEVMRTDLNELLQVCGSDHCFVITQLFSGDPATTEALAPDNFVFTTPLTSAQLPSPNVKIKRVDSRMDYEAVITLQTDRIALFVWLEADIPGIFSHNGFHMLEPKKQVVFTSYHPLNVQQFISHLKVTALKSTM